MYCKLLLSGRRSSGCVRDLRHGPGRSRERIFPRRTKTLGSDQSTVEKARCWRRCWRSRWGYRCRRVCRGRRW